MSLPPAAGQDAASQPAGSGPDRDRDPAGRPRNSRPRDGLGRPLDRQAAGQPVMPGDLALSPPQALALAQRLLDEQRPFHAHEVLEAAWHAAPPDDRDFWQGLAQLAVGMTHASRGNSRGAAALLRRGASGLAGYPPRRPHGVDTAAVAATADELAARIEAECPAGPAAGFAQQRGHAAPRLPRVAARAATGRTRWRREPGRARRLLRRGRPRRRTARIRYPARRWPQRRPRRRRCPLSASSGPPELPGSTFARIG